MSILNIMVFPNQWEYLLLGTMKSDNGMAHFHMFVVDIEK
jgi:hypothetical protein